jgi:hypothetical protein
MSEQKKASVNEELLESFFSHAGEAVAALVTPPGGHPIHLRPFIISGPNGISLRFDGFFPGISGLGLSKGSIKRLVADKETDNWSVTTIENETLTIAFFALVKIPAE